MPVLPMETNLVRSNGNQLQQALALLHEQTVQLSRSVPTLTSTWQGPSADIFADEVKPLLQAVESTIKRRVGGAVLETTGGHLIQGGCQVIQGDSGNGGDIRVLKENMLAGDAEDITEGSQAFVLAGQKVDKGETKRLIGGQGMNEAAVSAGELTQREVALVEGVELLSAVSLVVVGNEQGVVGVVLILFGQSLAEMLDMHGIEQGKLRLKEGQVRVGSDVVEGVPPVETGGFADGGERWWRLAASQRGEEVLFEREEAGPVIGISAMGAGETAVGRAQGDIEAVGAEIERQNGGCGLIHPVTSIYNKKRTSVTQGHCPGTRRWQQPRSDESLSAGEGTPWLTQGQQASLLQRQGSPVRCTRSV